MCVGPSPTVRGGITSLIEKIRGRLPDHIQFRVIATISKYTGSEHPERGSWLFQAMVFAGAFTRILFAGMFSRDVIFHVHLSMRGSTLRKGLICVALRVLRCRYVVHAHAAEDALFHEWVPELPRRVLSWGFRGADYFIALTAFWGEYYASRIRLRSGQLLRLPNPVVLPTFLPDRTNQATVNILFLGRIGQRKGAFEALEAFASLPEDIRKCSHLIFAGDGETSTVRELADHLGCSLQTSVLGWVDRQDAERLLAEADIFVLPSHGEGMSMALLEAMAWGLAVVTTNSGGADEFLGSGHNCILVEPGDVHDIAKALRRLTEDQQLRIRLGTEARRTAKRFGVDNYMMKLKCLYEDLASDPPVDNQIQAVFTMK